MSEDGLRHDWTVAELRAIHDLPLTDLLHRAQAVHRRHHAPDAVQLCTLLSVKTGGCVEDCGYCPQSRHHGAAPPERMLALGEVLAAARRAREAGASRFCMGAAWREPRDGAAFEQVLAMVRGVAALGLETCVTLGMLTDEQAARLKQAGLKVYNHNLDTSAEFYGAVVTTRTYEERLATLERVRRAGLEICCGGILGMGESVDDRLLLLATLARFRPHPESVPINALVRVPGTPLAARPPLDPLALVRAIATARVAMPASIVRLSAGRAELSREAQVLAFLAGANSLFFGDRLLTTPNAGEEEDRRLLADAGLHALVPPHAHG